MRYETVDMSEFTRRVRDEIYDKKEYEIALKWVRQYCKEGPDTNKTPFSRAEKDAQWIY